MGPLTIISAANRLWLEYKSPPESLDTDTQSLTENSVQADALKNKGFYASYESTCRYEDKKTGYKNNETNALQL